MCAYNYYCGGGDTVTAGRPRVKPGDTILVHAGTLQISSGILHRRSHHQCDHAVEGTYYLTASGTPEKPIVIKGAGDGEVIFDGNGNFNLFNVKAANYNYFEGVTIRNTDIAIWAGTQFIAGSKGLTVKRCRFENVNLGSFHELLRLERFLHRRQLFHRPGRSEASLRMDRRLLGPI